MEATGRDGGRGAWSYREQTVSSSYTINSSSGTISIGSQLPWVSMEAKAKHLEEMEEDTDEKLPRVEEDTDEELPRVENPFTARVFNPSQQHSANSLFPVVLLHPSSSLTPLKSTKKGRNR